MLEKTNTAFVLVDVQDKLLPVMHQRDALVASLAKLIDGMKALGVPIAWTEQYPQGLGPTVPEIAERLSGEPITKTAFSCWGEPRFAEALSELGRKQIVLAGIEAHVCVHQTAMDLLAAGYEVQVVADAVSSRTEANRLAALGKLAAAGVAVTTVEMVLFELLKVAEGPAFKAILRIVK
ncbi:MAG TPA: hydrolase [Phycisphaerae bacterium]|nr:hydrolase [Phycisphaerae bacterium]